MEFKHHLLENVSHSVITSTILSGPAYFVFYTNPNFTSTHKTSLSVWVMVNTSL